MIKPGTNPFGIDESAVAGATQSLIDSFLRSLPSGAATDFAAALAAAASNSGAHSEKLRGLEQSFYRDHLVLWKSIVDSKAESFSTPDGPDPRFSSADWNELPFFRYLHQAYLLNCRFVMNLAECADLEPHAKRRLAFVLRQAMDAASPANSPLTNPESIRLAAQSQGQSMAQGMKLLAADMARGRISMSDETAFEVGRNLAITPGAVVLENEVMQLIQYAPATTQVFERPLLIVPPFINKYYVLDLQPENSFARYCTQQGFTTFIVSWRNVPEELGELSWQDYVERGVLAPIKAAQSITGADHVNTLGFCVGGTLLASALAMLRKQTSMPSSSLTLLASLLNFSDSGEISVYVDPAFVEKAEREFAQGGVMPGSQLATTFATLRANDLIWQFVVNGYLKGQPPRAFDLLYWNSDGANLPGRLYAYYLRNMYLENNLCVPGKISLRGVPIDLGAIGLPSYVFAAQEDHIVPWRSAYRSMLLLGDNSEFVLGASGHIAGVVNPASKNRRHYWTNPDIVGNPDAWLKNAAQHAGSWWSHWSEWLKTKSGKQIEAPRKLGNRKYPEIEAAPGRYVAQRWPAPEQAAGLRPFHSGR
jgi:polyhydroxyalkanoate synthase subunit PhaC